MIMYVDAAERWGKHCANKLTAAGFLAGFLASAAGFLAVTFAFIAVTFGERHCTQDGPRTSFLIRP